jgi:hypothetical protein
MAAAGQTGELKVTGELRRSGNSGAGLRMQSLYRERSDNERCKYCDRPAVG